MRLKLLVLAVGAALVVYALIWGSESTSKIADYRRSTTLSQSADAADAGSADEVPNVMKGGVGEINNNLSNLKDSVQKTMDERPERVDEKVDESTQ